MSLPKCFMVKASYCSPSMRRAVSRPVDIVRHAVELQEQALAQVARGNAGRVERLHVVEHARHVAFVEVEPRG